MSNELKQVALQALAALEYHQEQTRPIHQTQEAIAALRETLAREQTLAPSIHQHNARVLQSILNEMREMLWAPAGANVVHVLRKHMRMAKVMHDALEYLSNLHPRRCHLAEVTRARDAIERYRALFQPSFHPVEEELPKC